MIAALTKNDLGVYARQTGRTKCPPFYFIIELVGIAVSIRHLAPAVPLVVTAGTCAGFLAAGAAGFAVARTGCLCEVLVTTAAVLG
jgi:hypothetical protein